MKYLCALLTLFLLPSLLLAQEGYVYDNLSMRSDILKMERKYAVYLPPDYESSERSYPVLYLLHGGGDDQSGWVQFGEVYHIANKAINEGTSTPMIIVMPDANTGQRGYFNSPSGDWRYEDFFFEEFIPYIEKTYRIRAEKQYRAIAGLSMGGGGTFLYALHHPELFAAACPLSASVGPVSVDEIDERRFSREWSGKEWTPDEKEAYFKRRSVLYMMETMPEEQKQAVKWYIDCGDDDHLFSRTNALVHAAMWENGIPHEYRMRDGEHNWTYWRTALPDVLAFITASFHR